MVNTCSLRGDWSSANLFTCRLTTQEPLFLPLPSHPPSIPRYLTFPSLASPASRLPSPSPPCLFCLFQTLPKFLLPVLSHVISPLERHLSSGGSLTSVRLSSDTHPFLFLPDLPVRGSGPSPSPSAGYGTFHRILSSSCSLYHLCAPSFQPARPGVHRGGSEEATWPVFPPLGSSRWG